eukprot:TRINITY_DN2189_c0_g1_i1.p1 TRINITY_DN2189_c0_g1~~TRINITY_DN2189_c0_g1_i1.p1  ORF type:complete len:150 (-),score=21.85 TRINITY_DN2189_c0_g1_i1:100-549(-)
MHEEGSRTSMLLCYGGGICFALGWWLWIDACAFSATQLDAKIDFGYWIPGIVSSFALILINIVSPAALDTSASWDNSMLARARGFLFFAFTIAFGGLIASVWLAIVHWFNDTSISNFPGIALILQSSFIFLAAVMVRFAKLPEDGYGGL